MMTERPVTPYTEFDEISVGDRLHFLTHHKASDGGAYTDSHTGIVTKISAKCLFVAGTGRHEGRRFRIADAEMDRRQVTVTR